MCGGARCKFLTGNEHNTSVRESAYLNSNYVISALTYALIHNVAKTSIGTVMAAHLDMLYQKFFLILIIPP